MEELKKPIFIDSHLRRVFERQIARTIKTPSIWGNEKINRLFLLYGQKGSGMTDAVLQLCVDNEIAYKDIVVTKDAKEMFELFESLKKRTDFIPLLIIRKGHLLQYHQNIFLTTYNLKQLKYPGIILVISEDIPGANESPFWEQFKHKYPMKLPNKDHYKKLLEYYFKRCTSPAVKKIDLNYDDLAISCDYATPADVKRFARRVIEHVIERYPEEEVEINDEMIKDFMYASLGVKELLCIINHDGNAIQNKYDPEGIRDVPTVEETEYREAKRHKIYIEK